jgi:hypothetical protein
MSSFRKHLADKTRGGSPFRAKMDLSNKNQVELLDRGEYASVSASLSTHMYAWINAYTRTHESIETHTYIQA